MSQTFLVGTGIERIYACCLASNGHLQLFNEYSSGKGSTWLLPKDENLYVVNEHSNRIETFNIDDRQQGKITLKDSISAIGHTPCSLDIDATGRWLAVANYGYQGTSNVVLFPFNASKYPDEKSARVTAIEGRGPHPDRQDHSYCHQVSFYRNFLYVVDLGTDTVSIYRFDETNGELSLMGSRVKLQAGAGPRHILFHPTKPLAFVCNELNSTVNVYRVHSSGGQLEFLQTIGTRREVDQQDSTKENYPAEIQLSPDQNHLLVSNRGDENLVVFDIRDQNDEVLHVQQHVDCYGSFPRYFTFDPTGNFLLIANQKTNNLICYLYDRQKHTFQFISELNNIESPQHLVFLS